MAVNDPKDPEVVNPKSPRTLTDDQIVTEPKHPRRSFLTATGALLVGAAAIVSGVRAEPQEKSSDPDAKKKEDTKASDPDAKKTPAGKKPKGKKSGSDKKSEKESDPDTKK